MQTLYLIILAILGWGLTVYFGFFRLRQYQWTRLKVESDLFLKLNQRGEQLFLKLSNLSILSEKNDQLNSKYQTVKQAYIQLWKEKIFLVNRGVVPKEVYTFWLDGVINELRFLFKQHPELRIEFLAIEAFAPILIYVDAQERLSETEVTAISHQYATLKPQLALPYH